MSDEYTRPEGISDRCWAWFGKYDRESLLIEIDRIITTDKPALSQLYEDLEMSRRSEGLLLEGLERIVQYVEENWKPGDKAYEIAVLCRIALGEEKE